jgi:hypothetical protein
MKTLAKQLEQEKKKRKKAEKDVMRWQHLAEARGNTIGTLERDKRISDATDQTANMFITYLASLVSTDNELTIPKADLYSLLKTKMAICSADKDNIIIKIIDTHETEKQEKVKMVERVEE